MKAINVILRCAAERREGRSEQIAGIIADVAGRHGAEGSLHVTDDTEQFLISADLVGFSREESSVIRAELRTSLGELLA
jgi:hypothetical protein